MKKMLLKVLTNGDGNVTIRTLLRLSRSSGSDTKRRNKPVGTSGVAGNLAGSARRTCFIDLSHVCGSIFERARFFYSKKGGIE
jgi:hypothetical protein